MRSVVAGKIDNFSIQAMLGMNFRILGDTIVDCVSSMIDKKFIPPILRPTDEQEADSGFLAGVLDVCVRK